MWSEKKFHQNKKENIHPLLISVAVETLHVITVTLLWWLEVAVSSRFSTAIQAALCSESV